MKKLFFVFRSNLAVYNNSLIHQTLCYFAILTLIIFPCLAHVSPLEWRGKVHKSVVEDPNFFEGCVPHFESIRWVTIPMNIVQEDVKSISKGTSGGNITTVPVQSDGSKNTKNGTEDSREDYACVHPFLFFLQLFIGGLLGLPIGFLFFLVLVGHLEHIFSIATLRKLRIPKFLYYDSCP